LELQSSSVFSFCLVATVENLAVNGSAGQIERR
jgi:hypothetical protein